VFGRGGLKPGEKKCDQMAGVFEAGKGLIEDFKKVNYDLVRVNFWLKKRNFVRLQRMAAFILLQRRLVVIMR
jgi:hypothetical protein